MARTIRRKNAELILEKKFGHKLAGQYTEYDYVYLEPEDRTGSAIHSHVRVPRLATKEEHLFTYLRLHGDGVDDYHKFRGHRPDKWARKYEEHTHRSKNRQEIIRFLKGCIDDVVGTELRRNPYWTW